MSDRGPDPPEWVALDGDEEVRFVVSPSRNLVLASLGLGFGLLIAMSVGVGFFTDLATGRAVSFVTLVFILVLIVGAYGLIKTRQYVLTSDRAIVGQGLRTRRQSAVDLDIVDDVRVDQSSWQEFLDVGTVRLVTTRGTSVEFALIERPDEVGQHVRQLTAVNMTDTARG